MDDKHIAWVAGLLEGEGSFFANSNGLSPRISCEMTDEDTIEKLREYCGGTVIKPAIRNGWKQSWVWRLGGEEAYLLMMLILPYMSKRRTEKIETLMANYNEYLDAKYLAESNLLCAAREYINTNKSLRAVADEFNVSYESVRKAAQKLSS